MIERTTPDLDFAMEQPAPKRLHSTFPAAVSFDKFAGHTNVSIKGKVSLLADIGAYTNLASSAWMDSQCASAVAAGREHDIKGSDLKKPLSVAGVGSGTHQCTQQVTV